MRNTGNNKRLRGIAVIIACLTIILLIQGCSAPAALRQATTIERDPKNGCDVNITLHVGIDGTDADVQIVQQELTECFGIACILPCRGDSTKGCKATTTVEVKKWSTLTEDQQKGFHHIRMVDDDGTASYVDAVGGNGKTIGGEWRRNVASRTYCHEVLHLAGLPDEYCDREYVTNILGRSFIRVSRNCEGATDPNNGNCCTPTAENTRCTRPCPGHESDLMATLGGYVTCDRVREVVAAAGLADCPDKCCAEPPHRTVPPRTTPRRPVEVYDDSMRSYHSGIPPVNFGATVYTGYSGLYTKDQVGTTVDKSTWNGPNIGLAFNVEYEPCKHWTVDGQVRLFEFDQNEHKHDYGTYSTDQAYRFHTMGIDAMAEYEFYKGVTVFGGPGVTFNLLTTVKSSYTSGGMTTNPGYHADKVDKKNVTGCFNLGFKYHLPVKTFIIEPFAETRLPFNQMLSVPTFTNYPFTFDVGATFIFYKFHPKKK